MLRGRCWLQQWIVSAISWSASSTVINNAEWKWWYKCWYCHPSKNIFLWVASNLLSRKKCISACISSVNILFLLCIIGLGMKRFKRFVSWRVGRWSPLIMRFRIFLANQCWMSKVCILYRIEIRCLHNHHTNLCLSRYYRVHFERWLLDYGFNA